MARPFDRLAQDIVHEAASALLAEARSQPSTSIAPPPRPDELLESAKTLVRDKPWTGGFAGKVFNRIAEQLGLPRPVVNPGAGTAPDNLPEPTRTATRGRLPDCIRGRFPSITTPFSHASKDTLTPVAAAGSSPSSLRKRFLTFRANLTRPVPPPMTKPHSKLHDAPDARRFLARPRQEGAIRSRAGGNPARTMSASDLHRSTAARLCHQAASRLPN